MKKKSIIASSLGNIVEWYDFALFIYLSPVFANLFFPSKNPHAAMIAVYGIFALGFICRPIGGIILGHFGDRYGRSKTLRVTLLFITAPTLLISILPTYAQVGIWAPVGLIFLRLIQGISIGGEYSGIVIYLAELAPKKHRAFITSFAATGANIGLLLGIGCISLVTHFLSNTQLNQFGWRLAFIIGSLFGFIVLYLRNHFLETPDFIALKKDNMIAKIPLFITLKKDYHLILKIIGLISLGGSLFYITFSYLNTYLIQYAHMTFKAANNLQMFFVASMLLLVPLAGLLCDKIGRKHMYFIICASLLITAVPCFEFFRTGHIALIILGISLLTLISSMEQATTLVTFVEIVPLKARYTTISLASNIGYTVFGGITPLIVTLLIQISHNKIAPAFYLMVTAIVTLSVVLVVLKKNYIKQL